jgi:SAM-dependent methyltransferase
MTGSVQPAAGRGPDASTVYALGASQGESDRLVRQPDELAAYTAVLLERVGLRPGHSAIDVGCGPRGILDLLAQRVLPGGRVAGLDANPAHAAMAAGFAAGRGLAGVQVVTADARRTGLRSGSFDLVHARTLLVNIPDPPQVVAEMVRLARPGGWVAAMEADTEHTICYPPHPAYTRLGEIFEVVFRRNGADPHIGRRVPELFRQAGLAGVEVDARVQLYPPDHPGRPGAQHAPVRAGDGTGGPGRAGGTGRRRPLPPGRSAHGGGIRPVLPGLGAQAGPGTGPRTRIASRTSRPPRRQCSRP